MKHIAPLLMLAMFSFFAFQSCKDDSPVDNPPVDNNDTTGGNDTNQVVDTITYTNDVKAILDGNCAFSGCHNSGSMVGSLSGYDDAKTFAGFGRILGAIKHESGFSPMPKNKDKLSDSTINIVEKWIDHGLKE